MRDKGLTTCIRPPCWPILFTSSLWHSQPSLACLPRPLMPVFSLAFNKASLTALVLRCALSCSIASLYLPPHIAHFRSTDLTCVCSSTSFQATAAACLQANCTAADQQAAIQLQQQECGCMHRLIDSLHVFSANWTS